MGVNGREIKVLHHTTKPNGMGIIDPNAPVHEMNEKERALHLVGSTATPYDEAGTSEASSSSVASHNNNNNNVENENDNDDDNDDDIAPTTRDFENTGLANNEQFGESWLGQSPMMKREITFADEVRPSGHRRQSSGLDHVPEQRAKELHIAFLERQRKNKEAGTLRIPGPRDFDRGDVPREVDQDDEDNELRPTMTRNTIPTSPRMDSERTGSQSSHAVDTELNGDDHPTKRGITIDEPQRPKRGTREHGEAREDGEDLSKSPSTRHRRYNVIAPLLKLRNRGEQPSMGRTATGLSRNRTFSFTKSQDKDMSAPIPYLSWQPTIGRNSAFVDLSEEQREELGGIEYRSLKTLAIILVSYFIGFHLLGVVVLVPWIVRSGTWGSIVSADGQNLTWWGIFTPASMFNDLGFTLTPDSMVSFQEAILPLLFGSFLIIIGNTGFPCMLRFVIWCLSIIVPVNSGIYEELRFLLDHPRRCFTLLFPAKATWWLFWILVLLNGIDLVFFIILDLNDPAVTVLSGGYRVLNGWFQAASTRTAGFACVNIAALHPAIQVSYLIMMYISVFPIAISVRRTNVYEEKSLGIWGGEEEDDEEGKSYVSQHLRRQLSFDLWYIFLGFFVIAIVEGSKLQDTNAYAFTLFAVLFEIVSAYGTVGLSLGYPGIDASFSAEFATLSKLIIIAMMIRGRHRGLPYALDRAILLPSENLHKNEATTEEPRHRRSSLATRESEETELDAHGLPRQHTATDRPDTAGLRHMRRGSAVSTASGRGVGERQADKSDRRRTRRLSMVVMSGLSAGPTIGNRKLD
ncbi:hypothetical protein MBLNU459_g3229t2 [Dothideomycetes sp. NU459]